VELVTTGASLTVPTEGGIALVAHGQQRDLRGPVDTLLVAGGPGARQCDSDELLVWLRRRAQYVRRLGSVCTGALVLAAAGLLEGRRATTHWAYAQEFAQRYPRVQVDTKPIWVQDGNVYTSAGITAGMDLALALLEEDHGSPAALTVARHLVLFLRRPGGEAQFSVALEAQSSGRTPFQALPLWIAENLRDDLSVEALAAHLAMSERNFARIFTRELGMTPGRYVERMRLDEARRSLEMTDFTVDEIAQRCGFASAEVFRRAFVRAFLTKPREYHDRFRSRASSRNP